MQFLIPFLIDLNPFLNKMARHTAGPEGFDGSRNP